MLSYPRLTLDLMEALGQSEREELMFRQNSLGLCAEDVIQIQMLPVTLHCLPGTERNFVHLLNGFCQHF